MPREAMLPVVSLRPSPANIFRDMDKSELAGLCDSVREFGIIHPLVVRLVDGGYEIISGHQRYRAALEVGLTEALCVVVEADDAQAEMMLIDANIQTRQLSPMELARAVRRKKELAGLVRGRHATGASLAQCANELDMSQRQFGKLDSLNDLIPPLQDLVESGRLGLAAAEKLSKLSQETQEEVYAALGDGIADLTSDEVKRLREDNERGNEVVELLGKQVRRLEADLAELGLMNSDKAALEERIRALQQKKREIEYDVLDRQAGMNAVEEREKKQGLALYRLLQTVAREVESVRPEIETLLGQGVSETLAPYVRKWGEAFQRLGNEILQATKDMVPPRTEGGNKR